MGLEAPLPSGGVCFFLNTSVVPVSPAVGEGTRSRCRRNDKRFMVGRLCFFFLSTSYQPNRNLGVMRQPLCAALSSFQISAHRRITPSLLTLLPLSPFLCLVGTLSLPNPPSSPSLLSFLIYFGLSRQVSPSLPAAAPKQMAAHSTSC